MKASYLTSTLLVATTVSAYSPSKFYANVDGMLEPLTSLELPALTYLALSGPRLPVPPEFTVEKEVATTGEGKKKNIFGIVNDYLVVGNPSKVKPIKLHLDGRSKVLDVTPYLCKWVHGSLRGFMMSKDHSTKLLKCVPVDIYFLPSEIDVNWVPGSRVMDKRDMSFLPEPEIEQVVPPLKTESDTLNPRGVPTKSASGDVESPPYDVSVPYSPTNFKGDIPDVTTPEAGISTDYLPFMYSR